MPPRFRIFFHRFRDFEWDKAKSDRCYAERGFDFGFASAIFQGEVLRRRDTREKVETRFQALGEVPGAILPVVFSIRTGGAGSSRPAARPKTRRASIMSDDGKYVVDRRRQRVDWDRLNQGPSADDLRELPATNSADWAEAELLVPIDEETYREFQTFLAKRRKTAARR
jgi:uncharacterized protein